MNLNTATAPSAETFHGPSWKERKQDYFSMMDAVQSGDVNRARRAYSNLTAGRTISPISPLARLGAALQSGTASTVERAARNLHQMRTGYSYQYQARKEAVEKSRSRSTRAKSLLSAAG